MQVDENTKSWLPLPTVLVRDVFKDRSMDLQQKWRTGTSKQGFLFVLPRVPVPFGVQAWASFVTDVAGSGRLDENFGDQRSTSIR